MKGASADAAPRAGAYFVSPPSQNSDGAVMLPVRSLRREEELLPSARE